MTITREQWDALPQVQALFNDMYDAVVRGDGLVVTVAGIPMARTTVFKREADDLITETKMCQNVFSGDFTKEKREVKADA